MITRILLLALAASVAVAQAQEKPEGEKPRRERRGPGGEEGGRERGPNFERAGISKEDAAKLRAAIEAAKDDPSVVAARDAAKQAFEAVKTAKEAGKSREEMEPLMKAAREAGRAVMEATSAAAVAKDPSLQPLIDKLKEARAKDGEGRGPKGGERKEGEGKGPRPERKKKDAAEAPAGA